MTKPDGERITRVETKMDDLTDRLAEVGLDVKEVKTLVQTKLTDHVAMFDRITGMEKEIVKIQTQANLWKWLSPTLAAIFGGVAMFLITEYFKTH